MNVLVDARKKAEAATEGMIDPDLRRTAFEVILKHLLEQSTPRPAHPSATTVPLASRGERLTIDREHDDPPSPRSTAERILALKAEGYFQTGRGMGEIRDELRAHGWMYALTAISGPLMKLVRHRELRRMMSGDGKKNFKYFNP